MRILLGGSSGFIGHALRTHFTLAGHEVVPLVRAGAGSAAGASEDAGKAPGGASIPWDPERGLLEPARLQGFDAVVHLGGVSIADVRWSAARKQAILESRTRSTLLLAERIAASPPAARPRAFVVASGVGYYGDRGNETLTETSRAGDGFLADVCRVWEEAAAPAARAGVRVAHARTGMVLGHGGALKAMLLPFRLGLGGPIGSGRQWWPWISLEDTARVYERLLEDESLTGPVNLVAPEGVTCADFARALGRALHRPAILPAPGFAVRLALGEMAGPLLLASAKVLPERLERAGFAFAEPRLEGALRAALA